MERCELHLYHEPCTFHEPLAYPRDLCSLLAFPVVCYHCVSYPQLCLWYDLPTTGSRRYICISCLDRHQQECGLTDSTVCMALNELADRGYCIDCSEKSKYPVFLKPGEYPPGTFTKFAKSK